MTTATARKASEKITKYADMFSAMGTEARLRIMQLLLSAHPDGMVVGEIQEELDIPNSTLSHHLDKLRMEDLVQSDAAKHVPPIHRKHRCSSGSTPVLVRGVLHTEQSSEARTDRSNLQIGVI